MGEDAARAAYRAEVERFGREYGLDKVQRRDVLLQFEGSTKDARKYIELWLARMENTFGVEAEIAFEYVKTSKGDFDQAENFLSLASKTRSNSARTRLSGGALSPREASFSASPSKRRASGAERSLTV